MKQRKFIVVLFAIFAMCCASTQSQGANSCGLQILQAENQPPGIVNHINTAISGFIYDIRICQEMKATGAPANVTYNIVEQTAIKTVTCSGYIKPYSPLVAIQIATGQGDVDYRYVGETAKCLVPDVVSRRYSFANSKLNS